MLKKSVVMIVALAVLAFCLSASFVAAVEEIDRELCSGCLVKSIYGDCGQAEQWADPCRCSDGKFGFDPECVSLSKVKSGLSPTKIIDEPEDGWGNNKIPVYEQRICQIESDCDPGEVLAKAECGGAMNCKVAIVGLTDSCQNCTRGLWRDDVSMPANYCKTCPVP